MRQYYQQQPNNVFNTYSHSTLFDNNYSSSFAAIVGPTTTASSSSFIPITSSNSTTILTTHHDSSTLASMVMSVAATMLLDNATTTTTHATGSEQHAAETVGAASASSSSSIMLNEPPPVEAWCFDLLLFYRSIGEDDPQARNVLAELEAYSKFSFWVNGIVTCLLSLFGLFGNAIFVAQLHGKSNHFSRRLANHLTALSAWDIALLFCCLFSYGLICILTNDGILPFVGVTAYLLLFFQPFASFCVTGTIWQVLAITVERYKAVSRPLEQRTRTGQFSLKAICGAIICGAFALNFLAVPFERKLVDCYEFVLDGFEIRKMIVQQDLVNNQFYAILSHLVPDLVFRAPTPIIAIAILTVRTLQIASAQRIVGHQQIIPRQRALGRNVHLMLTLLSVKFILCNTLYLFNTILMEVMGYGGKTSSQQTELEMEQYIRSLYLTDFSNLLLAIHSATNWLIFYKLDYKYLRCKDERKKRFAASFTISASSNTASSTWDHNIIDAQGAEVVLKRFREQREQISALILSSLCANSKTIGSALGLDADQATATISEQQQQQQQSSRAAAGAQHAAVNHEIFIENQRLRQHTSLLAEIIEAVLTPLTMPNYDGNSIQEWRDFCRLIGYNYSRVNAYLNAEQWKLVRTQLILAVSRNNNPQTILPSSFGGGSITTSSNSTNSSCRWGQPQIKVHPVLTNLQKALMRTFNCALREMKHGALCATVDERQTNSRRSLRCHGNSSGTNENQLATPFRLVKRMSWMNHGPPAGMVARTILPSKPTLTQFDSFSLVFGTDDRGGGGGGGEERKKPDAEQVNEENLRRSTVPESAAYLLITNSGNIENAGTNTAITGIGISRSLAKKQCVASKLQRNYKSNGNNVVRKQYSDSELFSTCI